MNTKVLKYIRKYYSDEIPGKAEAMQVYRAAYWPLNENWPDLEEVRKLKDKYTSDELIDLYTKWEKGFEDLAQVFYGKFKNTDKFNFCARCKEIARSPTFERCEECGNTWSIRSDEKNS